MRNNDSSFIILHIPHASRVIPGEIRKTFKLSDIELKKELIRKTDAFTDELFASDKSKSNSVVYSISRLVVDPERFAEDNMEPMSRKGMGVVYTRTSSGKILREYLTVEDRNNLLDKYYYPHHERLTIAVTDKLEILGKCLIIDCHSFSSSPLPCEDDQSIGRPDICIGTDEFHTPEWLTSKVVRLFQEFDFTVELNRPFSGTLVPMKFYQKEKSVMSIMIEINRSLYMYEETGQKNHNFKDCQSRLGNIIDLLRIELDRIR